MTQSSMRQQAEAALTPRHAPQAVELYRRFLKAPGDGEAGDWFNLGWALRRTGAHEAALAAYAVALQRGVNSPEEAHLNRAVILGEVLNRNTEAEAELQQALALRPDWPAALLNLGNLLEECGERDRAAACYDRLLAAGSTARLGERSEALARLAHLRPAAESPEMLDSLRAQVALDGGQDDPVAAANLRFALGRALDEAGRHDEAMTAFHDANRLAAALGPRYDAARAESGIAALLEACLAPAPRPEPEDDDPGPAPLFICGQYRSGSTLLEQVLSAHPLVAAGGELEIVPRWLSAELAPFPAALARLDAAGAAALARAYRSEQRLRVPHEPGVRYLTDKRPDNHLLIGVIKRVFPAARIVHTVRHPLDTAVSIYSQHLAQGRLPYASDLRAIGHQLALHARVMARWRERWGSDLHDFDYDLFVRDPRAALDPLLAFLGLPWDDALLGFHQRASAVRTASYWQVRRPLYQASSGRWRHYRQHLGPVLDGMRAGGLEPPGD
jgi:tetratricopeptide (TPR) repeat protein